MISRDTTMVPAGFSPFLRDHSQRSLRDLEESHVGSIPNQPAPSFDCEGPTAGSAFSTDKRIGDKDMLHH